MTLPKCVTVDHRGSDAGQEAEELRPFIQYLLRIGNGRELTYDDIGEGSARFLDDMLDPSQILERLLGEISEDLTHLHQDKQYMSEHTILALKNSINELIMQSFPREMPFDPSIIIL